ncbi:MAG: hypothetical protein JWM34_2909 [Ilumatobacteraceae bacterium]|nr:hypothetical protein [Ilumatobacteraceae bacterium]
MATIAAFAQPSGDDDARAQLARLGVTPELLTEARGRAQQDVDDCTDLDPPGSRGQIRHMRTVRYFRELMIPFGWTPDDRGNVGATVSPDGKIAIVVSTGNEGTGLLGERLRSKYPKGEVTQCRVLQNVQLNLLEDVLERLLQEEATYADVETRTTWMLLQHPAGNAVRAELSCPSGWDDSHRISEWSQRIPLDELTHGAYEVWTDDDDGGDHAGGFDVPVTPR